MGIFKDQARGVLVSAAVGAVLPDEVNQAKEVVCDLLPENMKAAIGVSAVAASLAYGAVKHRHQSEN